MKKIFTLFILLSAVDSKAEVNLTTGQFYSSNTVKLNSFLSMNFTLNTNNNFNGLIGKSTCSELDQKYNSKKQSVSYCGRDLKQKVSLNKANRVSYKADSKLYVFKKTGELVQVCSKDKCWAIKSTDDQIKLKRNNKIETVLYKKSNKIIQIKSKNQNLAKFDYTGDFVKSFTSYKPIRVSNYKYEDNKLVKISSDKSFIRLSYNKNLVSSIKNQDGCGETYNYKKIKSSKDLNTFKISLFNICENKNRYYTVSYDSKFRVRKLEDKQEYESFRFYKDQRLAKKTLRDSTDIFYKKNNKIKSLVSPTDGKASIFYSKNKISKIYYEKTKKTVNFTYKNNKIFNLKNSSGFQASFLYNKKTPTKIKTNGGTEVQFNYSNKTLKSLGLKSKDKTYVFKLKNNTSLNSAMQVAKFYKDIDKNIGYTTKYVPELKELF
jgi:hypothetical protein